MDNDQQTNQDLEGSGGADDFFSDVSGQQGQDQGQPAQPAQQKPDEGQPGQQTPPAQTPPQQPPSMRLSEDSINQLAAKLAPQSQQQKPPLTQEEFDQAFNIVRPTKDQWQAIRGEDEAAALAALTNLLHGTSKQAVTLAQYALSQEVQKLTQAFQPALEYARAQEMERLKEEFLEQNQDLKGYEPLLAEIRDRLVAQGVQFPDKATAFKTVAEEARKVLSKLPGAQQAGGNGSPQRSGNAGQMPALSGRKGNVGAGDAGASAGKSKEQKIVNLFGD